MGVRGQRLCAGLFFLFCGCLVAAARPRADPPHTAGTVTERGGGAIQAPSRSPGSTKRQYEGFNLLRTPPEGLPTSLGLRIRERDPQAEVASAQRVPGPFLPAWLLPDGRRLCLVAALPYAPAQVCATTRRALSHGIFIATLSQGSGAVRHRPLRVVLGVAPDDARVALVPGAHSLIRHPVQPTGVFAFADSSGETPRRIDFIYRSK